ncbi:MAG TPA: Rrf2 family transcriptional regulator [Verrucomicrobiae bacterium]|jgi:Rrf2 family protein|nr:Rrf2 family transcriptional regulator [Verrucomicrobiae bacterium]
MITKKTKYAIKALLMLAGSSGAEKPMLISELARKERLPKKFLELILLELKKSGILGSKKGKGGGYFLAKEPASIKLGTVMRILEGPLAPLPCLSRTAYRKCEECVDEQTCPIRAVMKDIHEANIAVLDGTSLQNMLEMAAQPERQEMYFI